MNDYSFVVKYTVKSISRRLIDCESEPIPQDEVASFIQTINNAGFALVSVNRVEEVEEDTDFENNHDIVVEEDID